MLQTASFGLGQLALQALLGEQAVAARTAAKSPSVGLAARMPPLEARAKRVIFLCMSGGPAHLDTFDYKPQTGKKQHPGSVFPFRQRGQSGLWISDLLPETARHADELCVINGMYADTGIHAQSFLQLHTGERLRERPSLGSWISYGLGTENQNLPAFISLNTSKTSVYSSAFLPSIYTGTPIGVNGEDMSTGDDQQRRRRSLAVADQAAATRLRANAQSPAPGRAAARRQARQRDPVDGTRLSNAGRSAGPARPQPRNAGHARPLSRRSTRRIGRRLQAVRLRSAMPAGAALPRSRRSVRRTEPRQLGPAQESPSRPRRPTARRPTRRSPRCSTTSSGAACWTTRSSSGAASSVAPA